MLRLAADSMLGRLAKWLRFLGIDTIYLKAGPLDPNPGRVLITRRTKAPHQPKLDGWAGVVRLSSDMFEEQIREALSALALGREDFRPMSRCGRCNRELQPLPPRQAVGRVPDFVLATQDRFANCPDCGRIYWPGTHHDRMMRIIQEFGPAGSDRGQDR